MSVVEVWIQNLDCEGCAAKIRKALCKLDGVDEIDINMDAQKVTVRGHVIEEEKVLKTVRRTGKAAEPWPFPAHSDFASFYKYPPHVTSHYYEMSSDSAARVHTFFRTPAAYSVTVASDEAVASLFSDDNPHACSIM